MNSKNLPQPPAISPQPLPDLLNIQRKDDIPAEFLGTPIEELLEYQNFRKVYQPQEQASMLISMCMDSRKKLSIPQNFAFIIRTGGANLRGMEFTVSYLIALLDLKYIALIGHNDCRMVNLFSRKDEFIKGMEANAGWDPETAASHFDHYAPLFNIRNEASFILSEQARLNELFPKVTVVPMIYNVGDNNLSIIQ